MVIVQTYREEPQTNYSFVSSENNSKFRFPYLYNMCAVIALAIIGSLCMYLSARYAQKSWITSDKIPYWVCFFSFSSIASQILIMICYTNIIGIWCDMMIVTISVIFTWKQYRQLSMVIQWSIVDLSVSRSIELEKYIRMKHRFNRIFTTLWVGLSCMLVANIIGLISKTTQYILNVSTHPFTVRSLCDTTTPSSMYGFRILCSVGAFFGLIGSLFFFVPYIGFGLCTMFVIL